MVRNLGQITGISLSTTILYIFMSAKMGSKVTGYVFGHDDLFVYGMNNVYRILGLLCLIRWIINLVLLLKRGNHK